MPRNLLAAAARRIYRRLPAPMHDRAQELVTKRSYAVNTRGLGADRVAAAWVSEHRRPVSIVIPSYNDFPFLSACLESIEATCANFDYEVIIVDDYCEPENRAKLRTLESNRIRVILKERREGFAVAVNVGMRAAAHDIVLLNSDIVAQEGWLEALQYTAYAVDPKVGLVSPKLVYPNGRIQYGGTYYARVLAPQWFGHLYVGSPATSRIANVPVYNTSVSGACVYITREAYGTLGGLDEEYWLGFEDVDYGLQAWASGIRCYYQPLSLLVHHESASRGYSQGKRELASMRHFWRRWEGLFLDRRTAAPLAVDYLVSGESDALWTQYVQEQAAWLSANGCPASVHMVAEGTVDELLVDKLSDVESLKIACDFGAATTTWLASVTSGKAVYLLPDVESGGFPDDPAKQAGIVAKYRPEFDFIAPNRWTADQLRAETAWETFGRIVPALPTKAREESPRSRIFATLGLDDDTRSWVDSVLGPLGATALHLKSAVPSPSELELLAQTKPVGVVALSAYPNALVPLALMATGAALIAIVNDKTRYEVLDGYNSLLVSGSDRNQLKGAIEDITNDPQVAKELSDNGFKTATRFADANGPKMLSLLKSIAITAP